MTAAATNDLRQQWDTQSYFLAPELISQAEASRLLEICEHAMRGWFVAEPHYGQSVGNDASAQMRHVNHPAFFRDRIGWWVELMEFIADERVLNIARQVMGGEPTYACTTFWFNPKGDSRNGGWHRDTQFLTQTDEEEKKMLWGEHPTGLQLQVALIPSDDAEVVPGSHLRWDTPEEYRIRKAEGSKNWESDAMPGALRVKLNAGDAVGFDPRALHRGRYHADKPRRTIMLSYSKPDSTPHHDYFTNQPWLLEPGLMERLSPRAQAFYKVFIDRYREHWKRNDKFKPT
jgi:ectoine hydroxylase-related dioxygenase (phytanoyl-CoA dioxygenase family)